MTLIAPHNFEIDMTDAWAELFDPEGDLDEVATGLFDCTYSPARFSDEYDECNATLVALQIKHHGGVRYLSREQVINIFGRKHMSTIEDNAADAYADRWRLGLYESVDDRSDDRHDDA